MRPAYLECSACAKRHEVGLRNLCDCGAPLFARYEGPEVARDRLRPRSDLWRYAPLLPLEDREIVSRGEGGTPILHAPRLAQDLGFRDLLVKDEGRNPTGTFKARGMAVAVPMAKTRGAKALGRTRNLQRATAEVLALWIRSSHRRHVLEIGTSNGYSTLWLAWAVQPGGGRITSVARSAAKHALADANLRQAGLRDAVELAQGEGAEVIARLDGPFDAVFFDADRSSAPSISRLASVGRSSSRSTHGTPSVAKVRLCWPSP